MIDQVTRNITLNQSNYLTIVIIAYLASEYISRFVNFTFNQYFLDYFIRTKLQNALTRKFMEKLARLDFAQLENGEIRNLIARVENTYAFRLPEIINRVNATVYNITALAFSLFLALKFNPIYFIILGIVSGPIYYLRAKYGNIAFTNYASNAPKTNYLWYMKSIFTNFPTLSEMKIYTLRGHFVHKTKLLQREVVTDYFKPMATYTVLSTISFLLVPVAIYFSLTHFIQGMEAKQFSLGDFTFFLNILFTFSNQISSILINIGSIYENSLFLNDFFYLTSIENKIKTPIHPYIFKKIDPRQIKFENVSFIYPGSSKLSLNKINLTIEKGEDVAIVGHNGAGKSTLIKLLFRFYDPIEGRILIDGKDLKSIDLDNWYSHLGVLFQDFARYFLTLRENIQFGNINLNNEEKIKEALIKAQGQDILKSLPRKYDQYLGRWFEGGIEMSGGQWQKVAIARAIYRNAPILIMDEPTSAIDADAEYEIFKNLLSLYKEQNLIFISHRFSTVRVAPKIIVLEGGEIVEQGSHEQLISNKRLYTKFFNMQKKGYE